MKATGIDRVWEQAAYVAALMEWLINNKMDHEADAEIATILQHNPWFMGIVFDVMKTH